MLPWVAPGAMCTPNSRVRCRGGVGNNRVDAQSREKDRQHRRTPKERNLAAGLQRLDTADIVRDRGVGQ